jgi:hypothetical protein
VGVPGTPCKPVDYRYIRLTVRVVGLLCEFCVVHVICDTVSASVTMSSDEYTSESYFSDSCVMSCSVILLCGLMDALDSVTTHDTAELRVYV